MAETNSITKHGQKSCSFTLLLTIWFLFTEFIHWDHYVRCMCLGQKEYDILLKGGHLIDPRNGIHGVKDVAIRNGLVAEIANHIESQNSTTVLDVKGMYITPGVIDIHTHLYYSTGIPNACVSDARKICNERKPI